MGPEEWEEWIEENMPRELYAQFRDSRNWMCEWRDKLIRDVEGQRNKWKRRALFFRRWMYDEVPTFIISEECRDSILSTLRERRQSRKVREARK